ncbi:MAG: hypothetical protein RL297_1989 [Pseudomonadota bacterium]|jgi:outer membrane protein OmpA-like peptidoglycan-associated protein
MNTQDNESEQRVVGVVLVTLILLIVGFVIGFGIHTSQAKPPVAETVPVSVTAPAPPVLTDEARVVVDQGVVKFYFASGKADLAAGAQEALAATVTAGKSGQRLMLSGFHDATGDPLKNAELAKQRALSVRDALVAAGVAESVIEMKKPEQMPNDGDLAEARRVEVTIQP